MEESEGLIEDEFPLFWRILWGVPMQSVNFFRNNSSQAGKRSIPEVPPSNLCFTHPVSHCSKRRQRLADTQLKIKFGQNEGIKRIYLIPKTEKDATIPVAEHITPSQLLKKEKQGRHSGENREQLIEYPMNSP